MERKLEGGQGRWSAQEEDGCKHVQGGKEAEKKGNLFIYYIYVNMCLLNEGIISIS